MQRIDGHKVHIIIPQATIDEIDRICKRQKVTRSTLLRNFIEFGCDTYKGFENVGIVKFSEMMDRAESTLKRSVGQQKLPTP